MRSILRLEATRLFVLFLYKRLHQIACDQLAALEGRDFGLLERLTHTREDVTRDLCGELARLEVAPDGLPLPVPTRRRIQRMTTDTLDVDLRIKQSLLGELRRRSTDLLAAEVAE